MTEDLVRVKSLRVVGLFGLYNHSVELKDDHVTIIHGPNGVGKTVFLRLTDSVLNGRYYEFFNTPFSSFHVVFGGGRSVDLINEGLLDKRGARLIKLVYRHENKSEEVLIDSENSNLLKIASQISDELPFVSQVGADSWLDSRTDEILSADEVISRHSSEVPSRYRGKLNSKEPKALQELRSRIKTHFIEAQRLIKISVVPEWRYRSPERVMTATVQEYSEDLKKRLETALANYAKESQRLDQTFPQRLIQDATVPLPLEKLKDQMTLVEQSRDRLKRIGLLDGDDSVNNAYPLNISQFDNLLPAQISVISVFAGDAKKKLSVLFDVAQRIEVLLEVLNKKFTNKKVRVSREAGISILGVDGGEIPIAALSSGEQHEIVLLYDLLFKVKPNTLVLLDEPELSLHVSWQKGFLGDILEIIRVAQFDVLMATHSPYIVGDRDDLLVSLSSVDER